MGTNNLLIINYLSYYLSLFIIKCNILYISHVENLRGRLFYNTIHSFGCKIISPTDYFYWPAHYNRQPDILDFFFSAISNHISHSIHNVWDLLLITVQFFSKLWNNLLLFLNDLPIYRYFFHPTRKPYKNTINQVCIVLLLLSKPS